MNTKQQQQAIIWGRFSSSQQSDGDSRDRQDRLNRALAKREGIKVLAEYFDEGTSVKEGATPMFKKLVAELPSGVGIICENLDRINRGHPWRAKAYIADILEAGHWIITSTDSTEYSAESIKEPNKVSAGDTQTSTAYAGNFYRIQRVREAKLEAIDLARKGIPSPLGAWLPSHLRYNFDTKRYDFNQGIADITERLFKEYASGKGTSNIAKGLNKDNVLTFGSKKAGAWTRSSISELLRYEGVIGALIIKGERMPGAFPPAIKEQLFYQVKALLDNNTKRGGNYTAERVNNVFRGLCHCSQCGSSIKVYKHKYIGCSGYREGKQDKNGKACSVKNMVRFPEMEREFIAWFVPEAKEALLGKDDNRSGIDALQAKQKALQGRIETTLTLLDDDAMPVPEVKARLTKLETEKRQVEANLAEARTEASSKAVLPDTIKQLETLIDGANLGDQDIRRKIANVVPSIIKDVVIDLQYRDTPSFKVSLIDGQVLEWLYNFVEYQQPIIGITKQGDFVLGKGKAIDGHYKQTKGKPA